MQLSFDNVSKHQHTFEYVDEHRKITIGRKTIKL